MAATIVFFIVLHPEQEIGFVRGVWHAEIAYPPVCQARWQIKEASNINVSNSGKTDFRKTVVRGESDSVQRKATGA
ncbi:hypothetical protein [Caballeronia sp. LZ034LL]|uniref:hypothetical protein n=1 Tax=Caballeronia sp. LZ034LL TaxID=3038567 RepID=UPI00285BC622|nr:hypothetical protein [Caballeronia sp. LZ034LL]MDR5835125.1 hypothetical protein [Caballeronia sp. LZ034LL]